MDLFDMLEEKVPEVIQSDLSAYKSEYHIILQRYGIEAPDALLEELAAIYTDPPPWAPWVK